MYIRNVHFCLLRYCAYLNGGTRVLEDLVSSHLRSRETKNKKHATKCTDNVESTRNSADHETDSTQLAQQHRPHDTLSLQKCPRPVKREQEEEEEEQDEDEGEEEDEEEMRGRGGGGGGGQ